MILVKINSEERRLEDAHESWITGQVKSGPPLCLRVRIEDEKATVHLASKGCARTGGGFGVPQWNHHERAIIDLWEKRGLDQLEFPPGAVVAFLKQLRNLL